MTWQTILDRHGVCNDARAWAVGQPSAYAAWRSCQRGDWLLWIAVKVGVDRRLLVRAVCACAREALVHVPAGEERPRITIETAEAWCDGRATLDEVRAATRGRSLAHSAKLVRRHIPWRAAKEAAGV